VILAARNKDRLASLVAGIPNAESLELDAGHVGGLLNTLNALPSVDCLVWNAAVLRSGHIADLDPERLRQEWTVNVASAVEAIRCLLPGMLDRQRGAILLTSGGLATDPWPQWASLAMGKAALRNLATGLHKDVGPSGVFVSAVQINGIVTAGGAFDPDEIAQEYLRLATSHRGSVDVNVVWAPDGSDPNYNAATT